MLHSNMTDEIGLPGRMMGTEWTAERLLSSVYTNMATHILAVASTVAARLALVD